MKTLAKGIGVLIAVAILFLVIVVNFGTVESRLECSGQVRRLGDDQQEPTRASLYAKIDTYRWFMLWFDHDAMITWEIRLDRPVYNRITGFGYYTDTSNDFGVRIANLDNTKEYGTFSPLSNRIFVLTTVDESEAFDGMCK